MKMHRRGFLGFLAAAPVAAKQAAHKVGEALVTPDPLTGLGPLQRLHGATAPIPSGFFEASSAASVQEALAAIRVFGLPKATKRELWRDAWNNQYIDPNIACLRSVSLVNKRRMSVIQEYERAVEEAPKRLQDRFVEAQYNKRVHSVINDWIY